MQKDGKFTNNQWFNPTNIKSLDCTACPLTTRSFIYAGEQSPHFITTGKVALLQLAFPVYKHSKSVKLARL
jgi:hypothetical protein